MAAILFKNGEKFLCLFRTFPLKSLHRCENGDLYFLIWFSLMVAVFFCFYLAGNESCPQPQTSEHLAAIEIMKLKHILILQNKIDLVKESQAREQSEQIARFVKGKITSLCNFFII